MYPSFADYLGSSVTEVANALANAPQFPLRGYGYYQQQRQQAGLPPPQAPQAAAAPNPLLDWAARQQQLTDAANRLSVPGLPPGAQAYPQALGAVREMSDAAYRGYPGQRPWPTVGILHGTNFTETPVLRLSPAQDAEDRRWQDQSRQHGT